MVSSARALNPHVIEDIDFTDNYLLCICGWTGQAYDTLGYSKHRKDSKPSEEVTIVTPAKRKNTFNTSNIKRVKVS